jgi:transposase
MYGDDYILREKGTRYELENIAIRPPTTGVAYHIAAWANWHAKSDQLEFYNDEELNQEFEHAQKAAEQAVESDHGPRPKKPRRRPKTETEEQFQQRIAEYNIKFAEWEARSPPQPKVAGKGNSMTQAYYCQRLLPIYLDTCQNLAAIHSHSFILLEDGDPSHGMRKVGLAQRLRNDAGIKTHQHPPHSPDLNPIEACWNILKQRLRCIPSLFSLSVEEFKRVANRVWQEISIDEVRSRISDMPERCKTLLKNDGNRIKGGKW